MTIRHCYYWIEYNCHPETCCHDEHYTFAVYEVKPNNLGPFKYGPSGVLAQFNSKSECEEFLTKCQNSYGLESPYMRY